MTGERGAATLLAVSLSLVVALVGVASASLGVMLAARERAATAAEAAALAAAVATYPGTNQGAPRALAGEYARRNGAFLVSCRCEMDAGLRPRTVSVTVTVPADLPVFGVIIVGKTARAEFDPRAWLGR